MAKPIQLQDPEGRQQCILTFDEAESLVSRGKARKVSRRVYRMNWPPAPPSQSRDTPCELTLHDMDAIAGLVRMHPREYERLVGHGFFAEATA